MALDGKVFNVSFIPITSFQGEDSTERKNNMKINLMEIKLTHEQKSKILQTLLSLLEEQDRVKFTILNPDQEETA